MGEGTAQAASVARRSVFKETDWSFPNSSPDPVHALHPYPAKFIPEIPAAALRLAPDQGLILDPFCGCGTTLVESVRTGRSAIGIDLNPIATLVARAKLSGWSQQDADLLRKHRNRLLSAVARGDAETLERACIEIPRLDHWFSPVAQHALAGAAWYLDCLDPEDPWRIRLAAAVSSIVVRVSRQESDTRYAAIDKPSSVDAILGGLGRAVEKVGQAAFVLAGQSKDNATAQVITADVANLTDHVPIGSVAAAVFSPPYPNAYEYWLYHKYRMYWLGLDPLEVRAREIGARPFYSGSGKLTGADFERQMAEVFGSLATVLRPDGLVFVVVGDSRIRGRYVDNGALLTRAASENGFALIAHANRVIRRRSKSFNLAVARAKDEHVLLFGRA